MTQKNEPGKKAAKKAEQEAAPEVSVTTGDAHPLSLDLYRTIEEERSKQGEYQKLAAPETTPKPVDFYTPPWEQSV